MSSQKIAEQLGVFSLVLAVLAFVPAIAPFTPALLGSVIAFFGTTVVQHAVQESMAKIKTL